MRAALSKLLLEGPLPYGFLEGTKRLMSDAVRPWSAPSLPSCLHRRSPSGPSKTKPHIITRFTTQIRRFLEAPTSSSCRARVHKRKAVQRLGPPSGCRGSVDYKHVELKACRFMQAWDLRGLGIAASRKHESEGASDNQLPSCTRIPPLVRPLLRRDHHHSERKRGRCSKS